MMFYDSPEVEKLQRLIKYKEEYLPKVTNKYAYQILQREIMLLKKDILPVVLSNTNIIHSEVAKVATTAFEVGLQYKVNGLLIYIPIDDNYSANPVIGIYNPRDQLNFGTAGAIDIYCEIINMDGNDTKYSPLHLPLNTLMNGNK